MNSPAKNNVVTNDTNIVSLIIHRFLPYWPLLLFFTIVCFMGAIVYLRVAPPTYEATAILLIKDEKKGSDDAAMVEALNVFRSKKIVENEIEVIQSRSMMKEVVNILGLYAPISMESPIRSTSAYITSPINILVKDPDNIIETKKVYFTYDIEKAQVNINGTKYPIDNWLNTPYGELMFVLNKKFKTKTNNKLFFSLYPTKKVVNEQLKKLNVTAANKLSSVVDLQFVDEVPSRAEDILNELIFAYNRAGINDKNALADNTMQFVDERLKYVRADLDSIEKQIQVYRSKQGAINLSEQSSVFLRNVGNNDQQLSLLEMQLAVLNQVQKFVNSGQSIGNIVPSTLGINDPILSQLLTKLSTTELEYEKAKITTAENNPILISLANESKQIRLSILENIRIQRINLTASYNQLNETNKKYASVLQTIPEKERKLLEISRQQTIINNVYNFLLQKKEETALSYASTIPDSRVLDVAESSIKPVSPKKILAFPVALIMALVLTFSCVYIKDFASNKVLFRSDIESRSIFPVLGEIEYIKNKKNASNQIGSSQSLFKIIAALGLFHKDNHIKKILITSTAKGDGKSFVSVNLAKALASSGKRVVLVDLDFNNTSISDLFFNDKTNGIADLLTGKISEFDLINTTTYENLFIVKAGELHGNYAESLSNNRIDSLFSYLQNSFDFIIIDTSSLDPIADDLILTQYSDTTLFIVRHAFTQKALLKSQNSNTSLRNAKNVKIIFNGIKTRGFLKGLGYGYGNEATYQTEAIKQHKTKTTTKALTEISS